jgi:HAD superfamily hydrolase (TIGR01509 family)
MALDKAKIRAVIFDIDGTLSDSDDQMVESMERLIKPFSFYLQEPRRKAIARWLVMALESPGNFIYSLADRFDLDSLFIRLLDNRSRRRKHKLRKYRMIPGIPKMLADLAARFPLAVVSARDEKTSMAFIDQFDFSQFFRLIVTAQSTRHTKPFPDPLLYAAEKMDIPPENCLMVGDTTVDMRAAKLAGMQAAGVLCGFGRERELRRAGADEIISSTTEIADILL